MSARAASNIRSVVVAGASRGINLAIARGFAERGADVVLLSRDPDRIESAAKQMRDDGLGALGFACDVRDYAAVEAAFAAAVEANGPVDVVISGAAGNFLAPALGLSANAFKTVVDIDLLGTFNIFRASYPWLKRPGASLIAISAGQAVHPTAFQVHACAAKAGVNMVTRCLALEWGPAGVRVNAISPGPISDTEGMARLAGDSATEAAIKGRLALRAYGTKQDIVEAALFLASEQARYITGAILNVDGGNDLAMPRSMPSPRHSDESPQDRAPLSRRRWAAGRAEGCRQAFQPPRQRFLSHRACTTAPASSAPPQGQRR
jgi:NAD(P)-dependent dehydrogenase (short-subunit alcohol dehydrogenase family)|tara:strand:- start:692 stop:1651 length:960 start_codon:yes stop_codon:yes gene_type:complete